MRRKMLPGLLLLGLTACGSSERATTSQDSSDENLRSSKAYVYALQAADESDAVHGVIGKHIQTGTVSGSVTEKDGASDTTLTIRLFGQAGAGTLHVHDTGTQPIQVRFVADDGKEIALPTLDVH